MLINNGLSRAKSEDWLRQNRRRGTLRRLFPGQPAFASLLSSIARQNRTFELDAARGLMDGIVQSVLSTVALLIAVQVFQAPDSLKALIAAGPFVGNMLSLFYSALLSNARASKATLAALPLVASAALLGCAAFTEQSLGFALFVTAAAMAFMLRLTFLAAVYQENYVAARRGALFGRGLLFSIVSGLAASLAFGALLDRDLDHYDLVLGVAALAALVSSTFVRAMPSTPPGARGHTNPFRNLGLVVRDRAFGYILLVWFVFGFANLALTPLRVVYLAEAKRGLHLSPLSVLVISGVVVETARLLFTPLWAWWFDRMNFVVLRMILNAFLAAGIVTFFASDDPVVIGAGSLLTGIGYAGGGVAWNLWVTRLAPPGTTHVYMSVHTFLTGVRGIVGPYVGFALLGRVGWHELSWLSAATIALSILMLAPAIGSGRLAAPPRRAAE